MAKDSAYCANGHIVPAGEKTCPVCGARAVSKGSAVRNAAIAGVLALGLVGGGIFGIHHLVTRNDEPPAAEVVVEQPAGQPAAEPAAPAQPAPAQPTGPAQTAAPANPDVALTDSAMVRDETGLLAGQSGALAEALNRVAEQTPYRLFVVYVNSFGGTNNVQWANQAAEQAGLGQNDMLLAVAVQDQQYGFSVANNVGISNTELDRIQNIIETNLGNAVRGQGGWADAPIAAANEIISAAGN